MAQPDRPQQAGQRGEAGDHSVPRVHSWELQVARFAVEAAQRGHVLRTMLDWDIDVWLEGLIPGCAVYPVPKAWRGGPLPYVDGAFDVVVVSAPEQMAEARRVAAVAVVDAIVRDEAGDDFTLSWEWLADPVPVPSVSIIIPTYNGLEHVISCLLGLEATLPEGFDGEIIIVDDASIDDTFSALEHFARRLPIVRPLRNETNVGFIDSCNRGAAVATGEILFFLNHDTIPQQGWLGPLLRTFDDPTVGAAGSALIYPDGTLQEAGGIVYRDGSAANFGRGIDPADPIARFAHDVDYCSGAALAIRRSLFERVGGFDTRYRPAYYEDTDLCMQVWQAGFRVRYQPDSVIMHVEGSSYGTDEQPGGKRYQVLNARVFAEKWASVLVEHPVRPVPIDRRAWTKSLWRERGEQVRRRVLVCVPRLPDPDTESGAKRTWDLITILQADGWDVVLGVEHPGGSLSVDQQLRQRGVLIMPVRDRRFVHLLQAASFDLAVIAFWYLADELLPLLRMESPATRVVVDTIDLHFLRRLRGGISGSDQRVLPPTMSTEVGEELLSEIAVYAVADAVWTVSEREGDILSQLLDRPGLAQTVPDMEVGVEDAVSLPERRGVVWVGNYNHPPNVEALHWLLEEIVPLLPPEFLARHPIRVLGSQLALAKVEDPPPGVEFVGWVPDLLPEYQHARMAIAPLRHGAGTKRKVVAALSSGAPMVITSVAAEGLGVVDGQDVLIADDPAGFAAAMTRLAEDDGLWVRLHANGSQSVREGHSPKYVGETVRRAVSDVLAKPAGPALVLPAPETRSTRPRAVVSATPNPVRAWPERGMVTVSWHAAHDRCETTVSVDGEPEKLFSNGCHGETRVAWLRVGRSYRFRLRALDEARTLLAETLVTTTADPEVEDGREEIGEATPQSRGIGARIREFVTGGGRRSP